MITSTFSAFYTDQLGAEIKNRANKQCPNGFNISTRSESEYDAIARAWNQGIDSHLEAITERSSTIQTDGRAYFTIHPDELHVLVRRLMEDPENETWDASRENPPGEDLAFGICNVLGITLI